MSVIDVPFTKVEGAQNDFVLVEDLESRYSDAERRMFTILACHRRRGVGADGSIFLDTGANGTDFRMSFYNPDGSVGSMCGNGGRCAAAYAHRRGLAASPMRFSVLDREYTGEVTEEGVKLHFPPPVEIRLHQSLAVETKLIPGHFIHTGAPHVVVFFEELRLPDVYSLAALDVATLGAHIRRLPEFEPAGTNVNFLSLQDGVVHIRTFEKGVEAETESCGTGTVASAIAAHLVRDVRPPISFLTHGGDRLCVGFLATGERVEDWSGLYYEGPVNIVFSGAIAIDVETRKIAGFTAVSS